MRKLGEENSERCELLFAVFFVGDVSFFFFFFKFEGLPQTYHLAKTGLEYCLLPLPYKGWDYRHILSHAASLLLFCFSFPFKNAVSLVRGILVKQELFPQVLQLFS